MINISNYEALFRKMPIPTMNPGAIKTALLVDDDKTIRDVMQWRPVMEGREFLDLVSQDQASLLKTLKAYCHPSIKNEPTPIQ